MTIVTFYTIVQFNELVVLECMLQAPSLSSSLFVLSTLQYIV